MRRCLCGFFLSLLLAGSLHAGESAGPAGEWIDRVWSGHPVGFGLLAERGHVIIAYYDGERQLTVAARAPGSSEWIEHKLEGVWNEGRKRSSTVIGWDSHNSIVMVADRDGYLHLSGNMHVDPLVYYRTNRPFDITSFERIDRMTGEHEGRCTYPHFFKNQAGDLFFSYRDGSSGNARDFCNRYDETTRTWRRHISAPLHDGEGQRSAYTLAPVLGPDGRFHILWMWRDTPDAATNQHLSYARSADLQNWEDSHGRPLELPITFGQGDIVDAAKPGEGLINTTYTLAFDPDGNPIALYHRYDADGHSQIFAARPTDDGWKRRALTTWDFRWAFGGGGSLEVDVYLLPPRNEPGGTLVVPYTSRSVKSGILRVDPQTLAPLAWRPPDPPVLPAELMRPMSTYPEMEVRTKVTVADGRRVVLRWETLPSNRDHPRAEIPPPTELRVFEFPQNTAAGF